MDNSSSPIITSQTVFAFAQILEAIQPWLVADPQYGELYTSMGAVLDNLLGDNLLRLQALRNPNVQNELLSRLIAALLGFEWDGISTLDEGVISKICQTITSYYARNGSGSNLIHKPFADGEFYNPNVFLNVQTTARLVSFALQNSVIIQQLWTKDYINFYTLDELQVIFNNQFGYYDTIYSTLQSSGASYQGTWDAATNTPYLVNGVGTNGWIFYCIQDGIVDFGDGAIDFKAGDVVEYQSGKWFKANNGVWYLSPHISIDVVDDNPKLQYAQLVSLFYYLAPVTMVIEVIKEKFSGVLRMYYNTQSSTYKGIYFGTAKAPPLEATTRIYYNTQSSVNQAVFIDSIAGNGTTAVAEINYNTQSGNSRSIFSATTQIN